MNPRLIAIAVVLSGVALASESGDWVFAYAQFEGSYAIYGGGLGDPVQPDARSKNVAFEVTGHVAKRMFDAMGPDLRNTCGAGDGQRMRQRAEVVCFYGAKQGYSCNFGFDLISGRSIGGSIC